MQKIIIVITFCICISTLVYADNYHQQKDELSKVLQTLELNLGTLKDQLNDYKSKHQITRRLQKSTAVKKSLSPLPLLKPLSPMDKEAASSAIFFAGGSPIPFVTNKQNQNYRQKPRFQNKVNKDNPYNKNNESSTKDKQDNLKDSSSNLSNSNLNSDMNYNNSSGGSSIITTNKKITFASNNFSEYFYSYPSTDTSTFTLNTNVIISMQLSGFSASSLKICNSNFSTCTDSLSQDGNTFNITSSIEESIQANQLFAAIQVTQSSATTKISVPVIYFQYTNGNSTFNMQVTFPNSTTDILSCADVDSTKQCTLKQSSQVGTVKIDTT